MSRNIYFRSPYIRAFFPVLIPDNIVLSILLTPCSKLYLCHISKKIRIFHCYCILLFFSIRIYSCHFRLSGIHHLRLGIYKLHNSIFCGYICMNTVLRFVTVILRFYCYLVGAVTLLFRLIPFDITLITFTPDRNLHCADPGFGSDIFQDYLKAAFFCTVILNLQFSCRCAYLKGCTSYKFLCLSICTVYMYLIDSCRFMIGNDCLCAPGSG